MLISTVAELFEQRDEETGTLMKSVVIKTTSKQSVFCQTSGLVPYAQLRPNDLIAVNRDNFLLYERLP